MPKGGQQNYFDQMIRQRGTDFISTLRPEQIQRSARTRIFREMIQGDIDYGVYGKYFQEPKFFENLLIAAGDELQNNTIIRDALTLLDQTYPGNNRVITLRGKYNGLVTVYNTIYNALYAMKMDDYNIGHLSNLAALLFCYRKYL